MIQLTYVWDCCELMQDSKIPGPCEQCVRSVLGLVWLGLLGGEEVLLCTWLCAHRAARVLEHMLVYVRVTLGGSVYRRAVKISRGWDRGLSLMTVVKRVRGLPSGVNGCPGLSPSTPSSSLAASSVQRFPPSLLFPSALLGSRLSPRGGPGAGSEEIGRASCRERV